MSLRHLADSCQDKIGSEFLCFVGLCIITAALLVLSTLGVDTSHGGIFDRLDYDVYRDGHVSVAQYVVDYVNSRQRKYRYCRQYQRLSP